MNKRLLAAVMALAMVFTTAAATGCRQISPKEYEKVQAMGDGYTIVWQGEQSTVVDRSGRELFELGRYRFLPDISLWDSDRSASGSYLAAYDDSGRGGVIDRSGRQVIPFSYQAVCFLSDQYALVGRADPEYPEEFSRSGDGLYGVVRLSDGRELTPLIYSEITMDNQGNFIARRAGSASTFHISPRGDVLEVPDLLQSTGCTPLGGALYGRLQGGSEELWEIYDSQGTALGVIRSLGKPVGLTGGALIVQSAQQLFGVSGVDGVNYLPSQYTEVTPLSDQWVQAVSQDGQRGVIEPLTGRWLVALDDYSDFVLADHVILYSQGGKWGALSPQPLLMGGGMEPVLSCTYDAIVPMGDDSFLVERYGRWAVTGRSADPRLDFGRYQTLTLLTADETGRGQVAARQRADGGWQLWETGPRETPASWAQSEVSQAESLGILTENLQYGYALPVTRAQFCQMLMAALEQATKLPMEDFLAVQASLNTDIHFTDHTDEYIDAASALGIVNGVSATEFAPESYLTRQQAAAMLYRASRLLGKEFPQGISLDFDDGEQIAAYAQAGVDFVSAAQDPLSGIAVMQGVGEGRFDPTGLYTKQQAAIALLRLERYWEE